MRQVLQDKKEMRQWRKSRWSGPNQRHERSCRPQSSGATALEGNTRRGDRGLFAVILCIQGLLPDYLGLEWARYFSVRQFTRLPWAAFLAVCTWQCELPQHIHLLGTAPLNCLREVLGSSLVFSWNNQGNSCLILYHLVSHVFVFCSGNSNLTTHYFLKLKIARSFLNFKYGSIILESPDLPR